jgi:hypothetical protein
MHLTKHSPTPSLCTALISSRRPMAPSGGAFTSSLWCRQYRSAPSTPTLSKFVITGIARTRWLGGNLELDSQATVFEAPWMLNGEWHLRTQALDCARRAFSRVMTRGGGKLISFRTIPLPRIAPYAIGLRMLVDFASLDIRERWLIDTIAVGRRRTAIVVTSSGFASDERLIFDAALRSATRLIERTRHGASV